MYFKLRNLALLFEWGTQGSGLPEISPFICTSALGASILGFVHIPGALGSP